jgi:hypothetical protein
VAQTLNNILNKTVVKESFVGQQPPSPTTSSSASGSLYPHQEEQVPFRLTDLHRSEIRKGLRILCNNQNAITPTMEFLADNDNFKVIEYLMKKGYTRTEQVLRQESGTVDKEGRPIFNKEQYGNKKYIGAYEMLTQHIEQNLDVYKVC